MVRGENSLNSLLYAQSTGIECEPSLPLSNASIGDEVWLHTNLFSRQAELAELIRSKMGECDVAVDSLRPRSQCLMIESGCPDNGAANSASAITSPYDSRQKRTTVAACFAGAAIAKESCGGT
jgi:hypothetical protein